MILLECKKAITSPIILILLLLFMAWNVFQIYDHSKYQEGLNVANELAEKYGVNFTEDSLKRVKKDLKVEVAELNSITERKVNQTFDNSFEFFDRLTYENEKYYSKSELQSFYETYLKEMYVETASSMDASYSKFNIIKMGEVEINRLGLTGAAAETLRVEYKKFADRFAELQKTNEQNQWFFAGKQYRMHSLLFRTIFVTIIIEAMILVVLATALITNYEFENKTQLVTYATKRGRKLMRDKLVASMLSTSIITIALLAVTLGTYFTFFDYSSLWKSAISSGFNWEYNFPYVSWWDMSVLTFFILGIVLLYICMHLFSLFTFGISVLFKNSYFTFILFALLFIALFMMQGFIPNSSNLMIIAGYNLSTLVLNPHQWWMASSGLIMFKNYEVVTVVAWGFIFTAICIFALKKFAKQDIS